MTWARLPGGGLAAVAPLLEHPRYEVFPAGSVADAVAAWVPAGMTVTVTASPTKGLDATLDLTEQLADVRRHAASEKHPRPDAHQRSDQPRHCAFAEEERANLRSCRAERPQNADLRSPLRHRNLECVVDDEHSNEQGERTGKVGSDGICT